MGIVPQPSNASTSATSGAELLAMGLSTTSLDPVETYFECITACSIDDGECVTQCVEVLREADA
mgnify:CR=1 FL=1